MRISLWSVTLCAALAVCCAPTMGPTPSGDGGQDGGSQDAGKPPLWPADSGTADAGVPGPPFFTWDLRSLYNLAPADLEGRRVAYDTLVAAACVQGIVNRDRANLYLLYKSNGSRDIDQLWLTRLGEPAVGRGLLSGRAQKSVKSLEEVLDTFPMAIRGLAVWDERVPATVNAAFTAAGAEDLIAVRWDASPQSLYAKLRARGLPVKVSLVNDNGSSRFLDKQGSGFVPDTQRQTSQSGKADAHVWAIEKYLKPGTLNPTELGHMMDSYWLGHPTDYAGNRQPTGQLQLTNRDWLVSKRGFPFDLSPWDDVPATDDPSQPIGTDTAVLREMLTHARAQAGEEVITVRGFMPWHFKYTDLEGLPAKYGGVMGEWTSVKLISPFAAGLDADAPGEATMANASFYAHVPISPIPEPQRRPTPEDLIGAGYLRGLAPNGGFEDGPDGWTLQTTDRAVYTDDATSGPRSHGGLRYLQCATAKAGDNAQDNLFRDGPGVAPGETITLRAFVRGPVGDVEGQLVIWALGGTTENAIVPFTAKGEWQEVRARLTVANGGHTSTRAQIYLRTSQKQLDVDDVAFYAGDPAASPVEPANYLLWYVGDFDSAAWMYSFSPQVWDEPGRGIVPLAWGFSGHVASRFPPFFHHVLATRTPRDFFVGADSGPGYGNPSQMGPAARNIWANAGVKAARVLDTSTGWLLDPLAPVEAEHMRAVTPYFGDGVLLTTGGGVPSGSVFERVPLVALNNLDGNSVAERANAALNATGRVVPSGPRFLAFRIVLQPGKEFVALSKEIVSSPYKVRVVDPYTFFGLFKQQLGASNSHRASFRNVTLPATAPVAQPINGSLTVRNDGWETWRSGGANQYRVGLSLTAKAPLPRQIPVYETRLTLPRDVGPGEEVTLTFRLPAPTAAGRMTLQIDMVEEAITWFESRGDIPVQQALTVVP